MAHALEALAVVAERGEHDSEWSSPERACLRYAQGWVRRGAGRDVMVTALGQRELVPLLR